MFWASFFVPHVITMLKKEIDYVDEPQDSFRISNMLKLKILQTRFKDLPEQVIQDVNSIDDISLLEKLFNYSIIVADFEDFQQNLEKAMLKK